MRLIWQNCPGHLRLIGNRDRQAFSDRIDQIAESDCERHGTTHVISCGHAHFALYDVGNRYFRLTYVCDPEAQRVFIYRCAYCDKTDAARILSNDLAIIAYITQQLQNLLKRFPPQLSVAA